ncbi:MAG: hypothetical protein LBM62_01915, partial [Mediterranea sp.]|nr:hypothetical protein [Mediterranea sp.]
LFRSEPNNAGGANSEKKNDKATVPVQFFDFLQQCADGALDLSKPLPNDAILRVWRQRDNGSEVMFGEYQMHVTLPIETVTGREITLPVTGGESDLLGVVCRSKTPERYQYKVKATINKGTRTASSTRTGGMAGVVNHTPTVTYNDKTPIPNGVLSGALPFDRKMQVTYPKLWFPNREIDGIKTTFEYYLVCPGGKDIPMPLATCVVKQAPLLPRARNAWEAAYSKDAENDKGNKRWDYDGNLDDDVFYVSYLIKNAFPGIINNGAVNGRYLGLRPQDQNRTFSYIHIAGGLYDEVTASPVRIEPKKGLIEEQWNKNEAVLWFQGDVGDQWVTQFQKAMPTGYDIETNAGKRIGSYQDVANFKLEENSAGTRIFKFVTGRFYTTSDKQITSVSFATMDNFMSNLNKWPSTMIPIAYNSERGLVAIGIDPSTKFVFVASSRLFADRSGEKQYLLFKYLVDYLVNAADYSAAFSDMLLDKVDGKDNPVCAPWDSCWGANSYPN